MNFETFLKETYGRVTAHQFEMHLHQQFPQLNLQTKVEWAVNYQMRVPFLTEMPLLRTKRYYVPRLDLKGRLLLAIGALFDSPAHWNAGFIPEDRPDLGRPTIPTITVELQQFGVLAVISSAWEGDWQLPRDRRERYYLYAGYCAYNDTLYVKR